MFIQSFEVNNLKALKARTKVRLIQLLDASGGPADHAVASYADMATPAGLKAVAAYAWGIGPNKAMVPATPLVRDAHAAGLRVHAYTSPHLAFFNERIRLAGELIGDEMLAETLAEVEAVNAGRPITFFEVTTAAGFLAF